MKLCQNCANDKQMSENTLFRQQTDTDSLKACKATSIDETVKKYQELVEVEHRLL